MPSNANYSLNDREELMINTLSSPSSSAVYHIFTIEGEETVSSEIPGLTVCFTYPYPLGGYITTGFTGTTGYICRLNDDLSVKWTRQCSEDVQDLSEDGRILLGGWSGSIRELDSDGNELHKASLGGHDYIHARYFHNKIAVAADKTYLLEADLTVAAAFGDIKFPRLHVCGDTFFVYSPGSHAPYAEMHYDGYCRQYDADGQERLNVTLKETDRPLGVGEAGTFYRKK